ncbi:MAG: choice-of-anchor D domain-containing protein [Verrucomicrobiia bacterium]
MSHTYAAGTYDVSLTVSGLGGANTQTQPGYITVLTPASISVLPVAYDFGTLATGMTAQTTFTVSNSGGTTVSNGTATVSSPFLIVSGSSFSIPGFGSTNVVVEFAPLDEDNFITNVVFATANGGNSTNQVTGIGLTLGSISVSPDTTDFGLVKTGTTSSSSLVVTNTGGMTVSNITATMTSGSAWFTISNNVTFPFNLSGYHAKSVSMVFTPGTATGALSGTVAFVSDNGGNSTNTLLGDGTGSGTTFIWTNGSGYWQSYTAWVTNGTSGTGGYPGFNDSALFTNAATYTVTLSNDVSAIGSNFFSNTSNTLATVTLNLGNYLLNPAYTGTSPGAFLVGDGSRSTTTVYLASSTVSGKGLYVPGRIVVGRNGIGTLFVTNGNVLVNNTILGNGNNARGTLVISGPSAVYSNASGASPLFSIGNATNSFGNALVISNQAVMVVGSTFRLGSGSTSGGSSNNTLLLDSGGMLVCGAGPITIGHNSTGKPPSYNNTATVQGGAVWNCQNHTFVIGSLSNVASGNYGATGNVLTIKSGGTVNNISWLTITATNTLDMQGGMMSGTTTNYGTIQGYGTFLKTITVASNAVLSASNSLGSLVFSNALNLTTGAVMQVSLGTTTYSSVVASNLQIRAGILDITNSGGFTNGVYTLFTYTRPHLTYEGLTIRNVPDTNLTYSIDINTTGQVNLVTAFPPVASFTAHPTNGVTPLDVTFTDTSVGTITNWVWDFGDGNTANVATGIVIHTYDTGGVYTVSLTINAYGGSSSATESNYIVLINPAHLVVDPVSLNYGSVTIGQTSNQNFSVINTGDVSLSGTATIAVAGPFAVTGGSPYTATGGQTSSVTVAFAPSAPGPTNGSVIFTSNGGDLTNNVTGIGVCIYALSSSGASFPAMGGTNTVGVITASPCLWNATPNDIWLTISSGGSGTGAGTVTYVVAPNASSSARTGTISIADQTFTVAQAGDTTPPTVVLTEPASGATVSNTIAVSATATDDVGVMSVEFYRGAGVLIGTITTPPYSVNFDTRTVSNGPNCFYARAYDAAHNVGSSLTNCVTVTDNDPAVPTGLTATAVSSNEVDLSWNASGGVVAGYKVFRYGVLIAMTTSTNDSDSGLATGTEYCYQVAAYDHVGRESALSADVCVQTFVAPGSLRGTYNGLVIQTNAPTHESSGSIELVVSKTGSFAASLRMGGRRSGFNGRFDGSGESTNTVVRRGLNALQVILHLDVADDSERITGTVSNDVFTSELLANRAVYNRTNLCPLAGSYTVVLEPPGGDSANIPQGNGYGRITVTTIGSGKLRGILSDGRRIAGNVPVSKYGTWPLYEALYKKQGSCIGWITFTTNSTFEATVDWFRPAISTARYYPSGFATNVTLTGGKYVSPKAGGSSPAGDRQITLGWGNLVSNIVQAVSVDANGNVTVLPPNRQDLRMKLQLSTGLFSGFFIHPSLEMPISFNGAVLQFDNSGAGYFLGTNESGFVVIGPMP